MVLEVDSQRSSLETFRSWPHYVAPGGKHGARGPDRLRYDQASIPAISGTVRISRTLGTSKIRSRPSSAAFDDILTSFSRPATTPSVATTSDHGTEKRLPSALPRTSAKVQYDVDVQSEAGTTTLSSVGDDELTREDAVHMSEHIRGGLCSLQLQDLQIPKRLRPLHDVDGPRTGHLPSKKRRLRLHLITSRLSQPFSLPATHILNREADADTPVLSRFVKYAAIGAKKAGHQTTLVRKAAILNRVRLSLRQAAVSRGHDRLWRMTDMGAMSHGLQLVTASTGAMFPGRSGEQVPGPIVPRVWRPHTTALNTGRPRAPPPVSATAPIDASPESDRPPPAARLSPLEETVHAHAPSGSFIMTPMEDADEDEVAFPAVELDRRYADLSEDDIEVYADFGVLFGAGSVGSPESSEEDQHFYEEYLDEVDGIIWAS